MPAANMIDVSQHNFHQVLQHSTLSPVLFYFWAPISNESTQLLPHLELLTEQYQGAFVLARLNCQEEQAIAAQFGIQAIPTIALFIEGQPVDGLGGPQPIEAIEEMLKRHLPSDEERLMQQGIDLVAQEQFTEARSILTTLSDEWRNKGEVKLALARCYLEAGDIDAAQAILSDIPLEYQQGEYKTLLAKLELHQQTANSPEIIALEQQWRSDLDNPNLAIELARQYHQVKRDEEALSLLWSWLSKNLNALDGDMKKTFMDILTALGQGHPLANQYRKKLYSLLY
ncbi:co-chaperone YbbN [Vibrio metoecus]|uniref:co-chaperone YbbN n=1 Tax=Vibrio metoecus TaxID=1481663 RepID=UPI0006D852D5|nr:co-chaperone YbbN [Vibrio metoecus]KQA21429.1 thioredoxin [Vibrio metoecus]KQB01254.1 thioredoxin [Vibrio metoecus]